MPKMRIHLMGRHAHRTPFSYDSYKNLFARSFTYVDDPTKADAIIFGYVTNIDEAADQLAALQAARPDLRLVVVSEEPLWDTTNSGDFLKRHNIRKVNDREFYYSVINHHTSKAYDFRRFPYFITTDDKFYLRYSRAFTRNAMLAPKELQAIWRNAPIRQAFFAESRTLAKKYHVAWPDIETWGLSVYRTDVAKAMPNSGTVRVGEGWGAKVKRQDLPDWHLDKLVMLRGKSRVVSAIENTSQRNYISEKIFDAFAAQALPLYWAPPSHRVHELVVENSFLNLFGLEPRESAKRIAAFEPDTAHARHHLETQARLRERFRYYDDYISERFEFAARLTEEMELIFAEAGNNTVSLSTPENH